MSEVNKRTIRLVREQAMRKAMLDKLDGLYTDDYVYHGIPLLGDLRGPIAFKEMAKGFIDAVSGFQETVEDQIAEGDKVVTRKVFRGTRDGHEVEIPVIDIVRVEDGQIVEHWNVVDRAAA